MKKKNSQEKIQGVRRRLIFITTSLLILIVVMGIFFQYLLPNGSTRILPNQPDNFSLTATSVIGQLTKNAQIATDVAAGITTLTPTNTPLPLDMIVDKWVADIEDRIGFSHPMIATVIKDLAFKYQNNLDAASEVGFAVQSYSYGSYIVVTISTTSEIPHDEILLAFELKEGVATFLGQYITRLSYVIRIQNTTFMDLNQNSHINIAFGYSDNTHCASSQLLILEFSEDGLKDISPIIDEQATGLFSGFSFTNIDNDRILEIIHPPFDSTYAYPEPCQISDEGFTYKWNGERYARIDNEKENQ